MMGRAFLSLVAVVAAAQPRQPDFIRDVQPILLARCASCHGGDKPQSGLSVHTRAGLLKGGENGPAIVPGNSKESLLIQRVTGFKAPVMPFGAEPLSDKEIQTLRDWIDQGAPLGEAATATGAAKLALRQPPVPAATIRSSENPIDHFSASYFQSRGINPPPRVSDGVFARRTYLDLWGLPPTPSELDDFLRDSQPGKRARLVQRLLAHMENYSEHWISFWNDLLRNDEGVIYHGARQSITRWLLKALEDNMPYDDFVRALLDPRRPVDPAGFLIGVNWRGDVSASQTPPMQAAQNSAQVFLGVNLKCNSCHDSFISNWKLKDAYGLASFFSEEELEIYRCDVKTGEKSAPKFLYPELGGVDPGATLEARRAAAARLFTSRENGRLARTIVNRYWKRLLGRGLVEPVDEMDGPPWHPDLLEWLASDLVAHGYDLHHLLARILTSETYQLPAVAASGRESRNYEFRGPLTRRLTAEQVLDSISSVTGEWPVLRPGKAGAGAYVRDWRLKSSPLARALGRPIRDQVFTDRNNEPTTLQALELVNGETMADLLHRGAARLLGRLRAPPSNLFDSGDLRSEKVPVDVDITGARELRLLIEDSDSYDPTRVVAGWADAELVGPGGTTRLADLPSPAHVEKRALRLRKREYPGSIVAAIPAETTYDLAGKGYTRFRAVVGVDDSSLKSDISPRVRFFVFTEEPDRKHLVRVDGDPPVPPGPPESEPEQLVVRLYRHALARDPTVEERRIANQFLTREGERGDSSEGLEDLLWSIFLSPEFQYID